MTSHDRPSSRRAAARGRDIALHAALLACCVWGAVAADVVSPGPRGRYSGFQKGNDFVQFYVAGTLARTGQFDALENQDRFREAQRDYFRPDAGAAFPPVYGPQIGLLFAPLSALPYLWAYGLWSGLTIALVLGSAMVFHRVSPALAGWRMPVLLATLAFPPLGYLVLDGQLSALAVAALALALIALQRGHRALAGAAIGLLGYKVSLFAPALAVCILAGEWTIVAAAVATGALQLAVSIPFAGLDVLRAHVENTLAFARSPDALSRNTYLMVSWRTFWFALLPRSLAWPAYAVSAIATLAVAARGWRTASTSLARVAVLALGIVLATPHCFVYDLVILIPAFVDSAAILVARQARALRALTWLSYLAPLGVPIAAATGLQPVTLVLAAWLLVRVRQAGG